MKYVLTILITTVIVFLGATVYYKGLPEFVRPQGVSITSVETIESPLPSPTAVPEDLSSVIKEALIAKYGSSSADMVVTVSKIEGEYAKGMVTEQGGGGMWFAAKENDSWTLVWDGNGIIECDDIFSFPEFPISMIPECWDASKSALLKR